MSEYLIVLVELINLCPELFTSVLPVLELISQAFYTTFVTWPMMKTCADQSELVNVGAQID